MKDRADTESGRAMKDIVNRAFRWGIAGMLIGPAAVYSLMLLVLYADARCAPGGTGVCQLDIGINLVLGVVFGFALFFVVSLVRGLRRRASEQA
jgi:hypothetical protein